MTNVENIYSDNLRRETNFWISSKFLPFHERDKETLFPSAKGKKKNVKISTHTSKLVPFHFCSSTTAVLLVNKDRERKFNWTKIDSSNRRGVPFPHPDNLADSFKAARLCNARLTGQALRGEEDDRRRGIERVEWGRSEKCSDSGRFMQGGNG